MITNLIFLWITKTKNIKFIWYFTSINKSDGILNQKEIDYSEKYWKIYHLIHPSTLISSVKYGNGMKKEAFGRGRDHPFCACRRGLGVSHVKCCGIAPFILTPIKQSWKYDLSFIINLNWNWSMVFFLKMFGSDSPGMHIKALPTANVLFCSFTLFYILFIFPAKVNTTYTYICIDLICSSCLEKRKEKSRKIVE